jgi:putative addiction module component (TIGR02574 family)
MSIAELEAEALKLAPEDQARLLHRLATALDSAEEPELTNVELERRWEAFRSGEDKGVPSEKVHAEARHRYGLA